jgi:hypothetical protein
VGAQPPLTSERALTSVAELLELAVWDALLVSEEEAEVELDALCRATRQTTVAGGSGK